MPSGGRRDLDHQVVAPDRLVQSPRLGERRLGVEREVGRDLQADVAVGAVARLVDRAQHVGRRLDVGDGQPLVEIDHTAVAGRLYALEAVVVFVRVADRLLEDRGVGRDAAQAVFLHELLELPLVDESAGDEVEPDRLILLRVQGLERVHVRSSFVFDFAPRSPPRRGALLPLVGEEWEVGVVPGRARRCRLNHPQPRFLSTRGREDSLSACAWPPERGRLPEPSPG